MLLTLSGCAADSAKNNAAQNTRVEDTQDPFAEYDRLEAVNRPIFSFNLLFDRLLLRPVTGIYHLLPGVVRATTDNFFTNLSEPLNIVEGTLQANPDIAFTSLSRFLVNSTMGVGGLYDYADKEDGLKYQDQNAGKTLAAWGVPPGSYVVIPLIGPSTIRGAAGTAADFVIDPVGYFLTTPENVAIDGANAVITRDETLTVVDDLYYKSLSPYESTRAAFLQHEGLVQPPKIPTY